MENTLITSVSEEIATEKQLNIIQQIKNFDTGKYSASDVSTQISAGWFDWFCTDKGLEEKTAKLYRYLKYIINSPRITKYKHENLYVFFKNNCPMNGRLYDDFRICDIKTKNVIYTIVPRSGHHSANGLGEVWGAENKFEKALFIGSWKEIKNYFNKA